MAKGYMKASKKTAAANNIANVNVVSEEEAKGTPLVDSSDASRLSSSTDEETAPPEKEVALRQLESDLSKREIGLIEREIKVLGLQKEVDRLRPLSGLYRVVKAMAT